MKPRFGFALAAAALIGAATLTAFQADAQQPPAPGPGDRPADARPGPRSLAPRAGFSGEDRAAFFDARLAAIHAGLRLTPDQEKLWSPVEAAARDLTQQMSNLRTKARTDGRPANPFEGMRRRGESASTIGAAMTRLADAALPLWNTMTDEQKRRYPMLARGMMGGDRGMDRGDRRGRGMDRGDRYHRHDRDHDDRRWRRGDNAAPAGRDMQRPEQRGEARPGPMRLGQMGTVDRVSVETITDDKMQLRWRRSARCQCF